MLSEVFVREVTEIKESRAEQNMREIESKKDRNEDKRRQFSGASESW